MVGLQLQRALEKKQIIWSGFSPSHSTEMALVMLDNNFWWVLDRGSTFILYLLNLSVAFDTIDHDIFLEMELTVLWGLPLFSRADSRPLFWGTSGLHLTFT